MEHAMFNASAIIRAIALALVVLGAAWIVSRLYFIYTALQRGWARCHRWFGLTRNGIIVRSERLVADESIGGYSPCGCYESVTMPFSPVETCRRIANEKCGLHAPRRSVREA
jgi:hypothetical protein